MSKRCHWCENEATRPDYREVDGMTSKILTCSPCFRISTDYLIKRKNGENMDFLNKKQIKDLEGKDWDVHPEGFYITIYPEDMNKDEWRQVCQQANVETDVAELTVLAFGVKKI